MSEIPKILHFIWIGPFCGTAALTQRHVSLLERWRALNGSDWTIKLWTHLDFADADVWETLPYAARQAVPALCADALRYEILLKHGGYYFDIDFLPLRSMDEFECRWGKTRTAVQNVLVCHETDMTLDKLSCSIGFIGCLKGAHSLKLMVSHVATAFSGSLDSRIPAAEQCGVKTWRKIIEATRGSACVIPTIVFYPYGWQQKYNETLEVCDNDLIEKYATDETIAVHLWDASWWSSKVTSL